MVIIIDLLFDRPCRTHATWTIERLTALWTDAFCAITMNYRYLLEEPSLA